MNDQGYQPSGLRPKSPENELISRLFPTWSELGYAIGLVTHILVILNVSYFIYLYCHKNEHMPWTCSDKRCTDVQWVGQENEPISIPMTNFWQGQTNYMVDTNTEAEYNIDSSIDTDAARMTELTPPTNLIQS
jgi:hypothetical protein